MLRSEIKLLRDYKFLLDEGHRYKVGYGGRGSGKSTSFAKAIVTRMLAEKDRRCVYGCYREVQKDLSDSVKAAIMNVIGESNLDEYFHTSITSHSILCTLNDNKFVFSGVKKNPQKIKSTERLKIAWLEEADNTSQDALDLIIPTLRMPGSELWATFNPNKRSDPIYQMFVDNEPPPRSIVVRRNFDSNPRFPEELEKERVYCQEHYPSKYRRVWLGEVGNIENQLLKPAWWQYYTNLVDVSKIITGCYITADTAYKTGTMNDYSVVQFWGYNGRSELYLLNQIRGKWEFPELVRRIKEFVVICSRFNRIVKPSRLFIEDKASGISLVQTLKRQNINAIAWKPRDYKYPDDKVGRVNESAMMVEGGKIFIPKNVRWINDFVDECSEFSEDKDAVVHDDQVDAFTMGCSVWRAYGGGA